MAVSEHPSWFVGSLTGALEFIYSLCLLECQESWGSARQPAPYLCYLEASAATRQSIMWVLSADRRVWGKTCPPVGFVHDSFVGPCLKSRQESEETMWFGAVDTVDAKTIRVGDRQIHWASSLQQTLRTSSLSFSYKPFVPLRPESGTWREEAFFNLRCMLQC